MATVIQPTDHFTGDTHFWHSTILKPDYGERPFSTVEKMNEHLIRVWNRCVPRNGRVFHVGDFSFGNRKRTEEILDRLHGQIHLVRGNHDRAIKGALAQRFASVQDYLELKTPDGTKVVMSHYPMVTWNKAHHGSWMLHGHSHGNLLDVGNRRIDVGVDTHTVFAPYSFEEIEARMDGRGFVQVDHHRESLRRDQ